VPKVKRATPDDYDYREGTQVSSVIFGLVMVVAIIVAGAAFLGGSLSKAGQRWSNVMDGASRVTGLSVKSVEIVGLEHVPPVARQVRDAAMIAEGENMFRADPYKIRDRVEATQLVTNVRVYRLWPDTVMIRADATQPTALWYNGSDWAVIDSLGRPMRSGVKAEHADLIRSTGGGAAEALPALSGALAHMPQIKSQLSLARRISERRWDLELSSGLVIRLPADEALSEGLASLATLEAQTSISRRPLTQIDLRLPGRVFLKPMAPPAANEGEA